MSEVFARRRIEIADMEKAIVQAPPATYISQGGVDFIAATQHYLAELGNDWSAFKIQRRAVMSPLWNSDAVVCLLKNTDFVLPGLQNLSSYGRSRARCAQNFHRAAEQHQLKFASGRRVDDRLKFSNMQIVAIPPDMKVADRGSSKN
jgi:hypothetical protein